MYEVRIPSKVRIVVRKLSPKYQSLIYDALLELKENPQLGKPLNRNLSKHYSYRVGVYRIVYKFNSKDKVVLILKVDHRSIAYN